MRAPSPASMKQRLELSIRVVEQPVPPAKKDVEEIVSPKAGGRRGALAQFGDLQAILLCAILDRFLATRERFGDRLERHPFFRQQVQLLHLVGSPGLAVAFEGFGAHASSSAGMGKVARISIASGRPLKGRMSPLSAPILPCASVAARSTER